MRRYGDYIKGRWYYLAKPDGPLPLLEIVDEKNERILRNCRDYLPTGGPMRLHILPGAYHAFDVKVFKHLRYGFAGAAMMYSEQATKTARNLVKSFLAKHLKN